MVAVQGAVARLDRFAVPAVIVGPRCRSMTAKRTVGVSGVVSQFE